VVVLSNPINGTSVERVRKPSYYIIAVILVFSLLFNVIQYSYISNLTSTYDQSASYRELETKYNDLYSKYQTLTQEYSTLSSEYGKLKHEALIPPYCSISGGEIKWVFYDLKRNTITWTMPIDTYRSYVAEDKPEDLLYFKTAEGTRAHYDIRPYIQPSFFGNIIVSLTSGRSDREFVKEVDNVKNQIVVYGQGLGDAPYQFPAETLTEGRGICADTTILMASMLIEGNRQANYNYHVCIWYVHLDNHTLADQPVQSNHVIVEVKFADGEQWCIETTGNQFFTYSQQFHGWRYEVTTINR